MKKICRNCKWWTKETNQLDIRTCTNPNFTFGYKKGYDDIASDEIVIENDEGWGCLMGGDFGCVHWEGGAK